MEKTATWAQLALAARSLPYILTIRFLGINHKTRMFKLLLTYYVVRMNSHVFGVNLIVKLRGKTQFVTSLVYRLDQIRYYGTWSLWMLVLWFSQLELSRDWL